MIVALVIVTLIVVLVSRELIALGHSRADRRRSRLLAVIAAPLLIGFFAISVQRLLLTPPPTQPAPASPVATPAATD
ncbi:MAG: hypothetical protein M3Z20_01980 [Chloroflexota bacterium]|nr:hypothetical protein [Chloroflexota bacterium]